MNLAGMPPDPNHLITCMCVECQAVDAWHDNFVYRLSWRLGLLNLGENFLVIGAMHRCWTGGHYNQSGWQPGCGREMP